MIDTLTKDLKHALRLFTQSPAFSLAAVAALTLGIGANTAIFSVVNAVLLRPVSFPDPDRVVMFMNATPQGTSPAASPAKFQHYRSQTEVVQDVSAFTPGIVNFTGSGVPQQLRSGRISSDFFTLVGATVAHGRMFTAEEDAPLGPKAVVLSHRLWTARFNGDPAVVGQAMSLSGVPHTIVGVLREFEFREFGPEPEIWVPFQLDPNTRDQGHYFTVAGRLRPGVTLEQGRARLDASAGEYRAKFPNALPDGNSFTVQPVGDALARNARSTLLVMIGAVSLVLLIACANVANLLLVRAASRRRELAIRSAIGGSRARIVRQLLTESVLLSLAGGGLGLGLGWAGIRALLAVNTAGLPRIGTDGSLVTLDWRVLLFTLLVSVGTGLIFGLLPALQSSKIDLTSTLNESGRTGSGARHNRTRSILVVVEVALALVLLIGSALLIRTAIALTRVDPGFDASNVLTLRMSLTGASYERAEAVEALIRNGVERLRAVPGVVSASATCCVPLQGGYGLPFLIAGRPLESGPFHGGAGWMTISPGYFEVFRIPVRRGRSFNERDHSGSTPVAIINEAMARQFWQNGADPLNDRLVIGRGVMREFATEQERQIVGIVADSRDGGLNSDPQPQMFVPQAQVPDAANALNVSLSPMAWVVRTQANPYALSSAIQEQLRQATGLPVANVRTMEEVVSLSTSRQQFNMWLMTVFGAAALLLAAIGIYGLMAYSVAQRTQEIGIRLALGAHASQLKRMVVWQGMRLAIIGVGLGLAASVALAEVISAFLFGVTARDPMVFVVVPLVLAAVALAAVWIPAMRASRVDPIVAMRAE